MGTAARNVNDKYIDPVKFGRLSVFPVGWRSEISHDTLYCYKRKNATLLYLFAWVVNGSWGGGRRNEEIAQVKNMMPIFTSSGRGYYL